MEIKNRLFPYPVLCGDTDDYISTTEFALEPHCRETLGEIIIGYEYILSCSSLDNLIRRRQAEYVLHIECSATCYRKVLRSSIPHIECRIPKSRVNGEIKVVAMIVAAANISGYTSAELNEDYADESISFKRGSILAYRNLPSIHIKKKLEDAANNESFFTVIKRVSLDPEACEPIEYNLYGDKIKIIVDEKTYAAYITNKTTPSLAMSLLVFPALIYMINEASDNPELYSQYEWFRHLEKYYSYQGKSFTEDVLFSNENPVKLAQEMLQNPVNRAYADITLE